MPASAASLRKIASAVGERQMLPVHTNKTPNLLPDIGLPNIESARETDFGTPRRRAACTSARGGPPPGLAPQAHSRGPFLCPRKGLGTGIPADIHRGRNY